MRLFTGISLASNAEARFSALLDDLRPAADIKWSPVSNLHITCKFIGAWPDDRLIDMKTALANIPPLGQVPISISGFGFFPDARHPHSFFARVKADPALAALVAAIDQSLVSLGCPAETRAFHPHVTLARVRRTNDLRALHARSAAMTDCDFGSFIARDFHLYLSQPTPHGSVYTKLATYDLVREQNVI